MASISHLVTIHLLLLIPSISPLLIDLSPSLPLAQAPIAALEKCQWDSYNLLAALTPTELILLDQDINVLHKETLPSDFILVEPYSLKFLAPDRRLLLCAPTCPDCPLCYSWSLNAQGQLTDLAKIPRHDLLKNSKNLAISSAGEGSFYLASFNDDKFKPSWVFKFSLDGQELGATSDGGLEPNGLNQPALNNIYAFSRGNYSYFVRHAYRENKISHKDEWVTRLTRLCNLDKTTKLRSRADLQLDCSVGEIKAASYDSESNRLMIYTQTDLEYHNEQWSDKDSICSFELSRMDEAIDRMWDVCQSTTKSESNSCKDKKSKDLEHCKYYTHSGTAYCSKYYKDDKSYQMCHLEDGPLANSHLESFSPLEGKLVWEKVTRGVPHTEAVALLPGGDETAFVVYKNGVDRLLLKDHQNSVKQQYVTLWSAIAQINSSAQAQMLELEPKRMFLVNDTTVTSTSISCSGLYKTCSDLSAVVLDQEPLKCGWCFEPDIEKTGRAQSTCNYVSLRQDPCPPVWHQDAISTTQSEENWTVSFPGDGLRKLDVQSIEICSESCQITQHEDSLLTCNIYAPSSPLTVGCSIEITAEIESQSYILSFPLLGKGAALPSSTDDPADGLATTTVVLAVAFVCFVVVLGAIVYYFKRRNTKSTPDDSSSILPFHNGRAPHRTYQMPRSDGGERYVGPQIQMDDVPYEDLRFLVPEKSIIELDALRLDTQIGQGHFGIVYRATYTAPDSKETKVAVKTLHAGMPGVRDFLQEGLRMENFNHPRVMTLMGISFTETHYPMLITAFMCEGDLLKYIRDANNTPTLRQLLNFGVQIAEGMQYLHKIKFIHRDLAARNCMLDDSLMIKIADFGLCRDVYVEGIYEPRHRDRDLPLRWMAPEGIELLEYTLKGDVWSYGVVLWELMTRGSQPYAGIQGYNLLSYLRMGSRLSHPEYCPDQLYEIMLSCWRLAPDQRPSFVDLCLSVPSVIRALERDQKRSSMLNSHYEPVRLSAV